MTKKREHFSVRHRRTIRMERIEEPAPGTASVLVPAVLPAMRGEGDTDYVCGACGVVLCEKLDAGQIEFLVFKCPACGAHSRVSSLVVV